LHHIVDNPLFAACFIYFVYFACFQPADHRVESELMENFQDIDFKDLKHQQAGFDGKCS
jgi:hypothetical protein